MAITLASAMEKKLKAMGGAAGAPVSSKGVFRPFAQVSTLCRGAKFQRSKGLLG